MDFKVHNLIFYKLIKFLKNHVLYLYNRMRIFRTFRKCIIILIKDRVFEKNLKFNLKKFRSWTLKWRNFDFSKWKLQFHFRYSLIKLMNLLMSLVKTASGYLLVRMSSKYGKNWWWLNIRNRLMNTNKIYTLTNSTDLRKALKYLKDFNLYGFIWM